MDNIKTLFFVALTSVLAACATAPAGQSNASADDDDANWMSMSGSFNGWRQIGDANWRIEDGAFVADSGNGDLVTENSYTDVEVKLEFWVDETANSGVFLRASNPDQIADRNAYEINIYDTRPDQTYRTGGIVNFMPPAVVINTGGRWNTYDVSIRDHHIIVKLNGVTTAVLEDDTYDAGPIALQHGAGVVKFRNVQIREL